MEDHLELPSLQYQKDQSSLVSHLMQTLNMRALSFIVRI